jgi:hypothetical protein
VNEKKEEASSLDMPTGLVLNSMCLTVSKMETM